MHMASWCPGDDVYVYTWTAQESLCSSEWLRRKLLEMVLGDFEVDRGTQDLWFTLWLCQNSYWKWPFIVDFPMKNCDFQ